MFPSPARPTAGRARNPPLVAPFAHTPAQWDTIDRCDGTLTKLKRVTVDVRDFHRRKTITVHAGHSYLARAFDRGHR